MYSHLDLRLLCSYLFAHAVCAVVSSVYRSRWSISTGRNEYFIIIGVRHVATAAPAERAPAVVRRETAVSKVIFWHLCFYMRRKLYMCLKTLHVTRKIHLVEYMYMCLTSTYTYTHSCIL